jgi:hypothetical protein
MAPSEQTEQEEIAHQEEEFAHQEEEIAHH